MRQLFTPLLFLSLCLLQTYGDDLATGKELYNAAGSCVACHMADGKGQPGSIPPLAGSEWLKGDIDRTSAIVLRGLMGPIKVNNTKYYSAMPPQLLFDDEQLAHIINYVSVTWGEKKQTTAARVKELRDTLPVDVYTPEAILKAYPFDKNLAKRNGTYTPDYDDLLLDVTEPVVYRTFMPGASPAAFAVALPGNHYYCWDAGECRLRYVWTKGGFIRGNQRHWSSNGKPVAQMNGLPYYRARSSLLKEEHYKDLARTNMQEPFYDTTQAQDFPIRIAGINDTRARYRGYRLIDAYPEFRYTLGNVEIRELIRVTEAGDGIERHFTINANSTVTVTLTPSPDCATSVSKGSLADDGTLTLTPAEARAFRITHTENGGAQ